jgi:hypothetical protein
MNKSMKRSMITNNNWYKSMLAGNDFSHYELISTTVLGVTAASVTFSSLGDYSSTYKHLQIRTTARSSGSGSLGTINMTINGDTGANYASHVLFGNGSSVNSFGAANRTSFGASLHANSGATANSFGASVIDILDPYSTTKNKTVRSFGGVGGAEVTLNSGHRRNTESVTSFTLTPQSGSFVSGSRFSIYGIKG